MIPDMVKIVSPVICYVLIITKILNLETWEKRESITLIAPVNPSFKTPAPFFTFTTRQKNAKWEKIYLLAGEILIM